MQQFVAWAHADIAYKIKKKIQKKQRNEPKKMCLSALAAGRGRGNGHRNMSQQAKVKDSAKIRGVISCLTVKKKITKKRLYKQVKNIE